MYSRLIDGEKKTYLHRWRSTEIRNVLKTVYFNFFHLISFCAFARYFYLFLTITVIDVPGNHAPIESKFYTYYIHTAFISVYTVYIKIYYENNKCLYYYYIRINVYIIWIIIITCLKTRLDVSIQRRSNTKLLFIKILQVSIPWASDFLRCFHADCWHNLVWCVRTISRDVLHSLSFDLKDRRSSDHPAHRRPLKYVFRNPRPWRSGKQPIEN